MKAAGGAARGRAERSAPWEHAGSPRGPLAPPALVTAPNTRRVGPCWCTPKARGDTLARRQDAPLAPPPDQSRATPAARDERPRPTSQPPPASRQSPPEAVAARVSLAVARAHPTARRGGGAASYRSFANKNPPPETPLPIVIDIQVRALHSHRHDGRKTSPPRAAGKSLWSIVGYYTPPPRPHPPCPRPTRQEWCLRPSRSPEYPPRRPPWACDMPAWRVGQRRPLHTQIHFPRRGRAPIGRVAAPRGVWAARSVRPRAATTAVTPQCLGPPRPAPGPLLCGGFGRPPTLLCAPP